MEIDVYYSTTSRWIYGEDLGRWRCGWGRRERWMVLKVEDASRRAVGTYGW